MYVAKLVSQNCNDSPSHMYTHVHLQYYLPEVSADNPSFNLKLRPFLAMVEATLSM